MHKFITLLALGLALSFGAFAQMSDSQVLKYLQEGHKTGLSQTQMAAELLKRGVTMDQMERIRAKYEESSPSAAPEQNRMRLAPMEEITGVNLSAQEAGRMQDSIRKASPKSYKQVFGRNIFTTKNLTFEPNSNLATPLNYKLGPGDEVIIDVWGASENTIRQTISPEGSINVAGIGPVYFNGMTVKEANSHLQREFSRIYSGISGHTSQIKLTLGQIRSIQISIMGEVTVPGTYTLSSFSSVFHALYRAGGVNDIGSLRGIKVVRGGKKVADVDVYDYILKGAAGDDVRLMEGDVILVPPYESLVKIGGKVKRPMYYEMAQGETLATLLDYAGGFTGDAYSKTIRVIRLSGREKQILNVDEADFAAFGLMDEDALTVGAVLDRYENMVEVRGAVYREGMYQLGGDANTVKTLINKAEGLRGDAFLDRAQLQREHDDLSLEMIPVNLRGIMDGSVADQPLQRNDVLYIPGIQDLKEPETLTIHGHVAHPGAFRFAANMTIEDLVVLAGGLLESASTAKVDVSRRIKDAANTSYSSRVGQTFSFELSDGLVIKGDTAFRLEPFDEVYIRRSPGYHTQQNVNVLGEVLFGGEYSMSKKNERLSELITKAGGITPDAYARGARLIRRMTDEEVRRRDDVVKLTNLGGKDSVSLASLDLSNVYSVGIDLEQAMKHPGSDDDLVLKEGDMLIVPAYVSTVTVNGSVMYPNTVLYKKGERISHYINQAGGYATQAKRSKVYVVYMNGTVTKSKSMKTRLIEPGCEIVVPSKEVKSKMSTAEILGLSTNVASLATVVLALTNMFK